jgi:glycosyltransferase involved in cell wall biosynthesis
MSFDIVCFSHLRWNFVYQRPQHLLSRFRKYHRVFVIEEPVYDAPSRFNEIYQDPKSSVWIVVPHLPHSAKDDEVLEAQRSLLDLFMDSMNIKQYLLWYYSPMALGFSDHLQPEIIVYDCMDELSAFRFAPPALKYYESLLLDIAHIVFTGGHHLFEAKAHLHNNIHPFPSSIDKEHFMKAREISEGPFDQQFIPHPRIGYYGVVDERFDIPLLNEMASKRPGWSFVIIGPVVKIDPDSLPKRENIYYLGSKEYRQLPAYLGGWDVAMMPFALNESTKYISPTKTPEYLAGGKQVVSTSIRDVVVPYGQEGIVKIADTPDDFIAAIEELLLNTHYDTWLQKVDEFLADNSWDKTWKQMWKLIAETYERKKIVIDKNKEEVYV